MADLEIVVNTIDNSSAVLMGIVSGGVSALTEALLGGLTTAWESVSGAAADAFKGALDVEKQQASLGALIKSTGDVSGVTADSVNWLAEKFKDLAGGSAEAIVNIEEIGIRSGAISSTQMPDFIKTVTDLGAVMGDTSTAATLLARAQEDPVGALGKLTRAGILFSAAQKEQIKDMVKAGDAAGATALIMARVAEATGGAAAAAADTLAGRWEILKNNLLDAGKGIAEKLLPGIETLFDTYIKPNIPVIESLASAFADKLGPAMGTLVGIITDITSQGGDMGVMFDDLNETFPGLQKNFGGVEDAILSLQRNGLAGLSDAFAAMLAWVQSQAPVWGAQLAKWGEQLWKWIAPMIPPMLLELGKLYVQLLIWMYGTVYPAIIVQLAKWGLAFIEWIAPMIPPLIAEAQKLAAQLWAWIQAQLPPLEAQLQAWGVQLWAWVSPMIPPLIAEVQKLAGQLMDWIAAQIPPLIAQLLRWGEEFVNWVGPQIGPLLAALGGLLGQLSAWAWGTALPEIILQLANWAVAFSEWVWKPGGAKDQILPALAGLLLAVGKFVDTEMIPGFIGFAEGFIGGITTDLGNKVPDLIANVKGIGVSIIDGIKSGIAGALGGLIGAAVGAVQSAIDAAKRAAGVSSPSTVFAEIGGNMMAGMAMGISGSNAPARAAAGAVNSVANSTTNHNYNVTANYPMQDHRTLAQDLRLLGRLAH